VIGHKSSATIRHNGDDGIVRLALYMLSAQRPDAVHIGPPKFSIASLGIMAVVSGMVIVASLTSDY
jgi:hypothetical protein